jgi:N utilization substance protein A
MQGKEILKLVDVLSNERGIPKDDVFEALEVALATAARRDFGKNKLVAKINRKTGEYQIFRVWEVVDDNEEEFDDAIHLYDDQAEEKFGIAYKVGDTVEEFLTSEPLGRQAAQVFKQNIRENLKKAQKQENQKNYLDRVGELFFVTVKKFSKGDVIVAITDEVEGVIPKENTVPGERFKIGEKVNAILLDVVDNYKGQQLVLDRASPEYVKGLMKKEITEVYNENIVIRSVARKAGVKTIAMVESVAPYVDALRECIGPKGMRIKFVSENMNGEAVSLVEGEKDMVQTYLNILKPVEPVSMYIDEETKTVDFALEEDDIERVSGKTGLNKSLLEDLIGMKINLLTEEEFEAKQDNNLSAVVEMFEKEMNVDQELAEILVELGFEDVSSVAFAPKHVFFEVEGIDDELVTAIQSAAREAVKKLENEEDEKSGLKELKSVDSLTLQKLKAAGVKTRDDLAELSVLELLDVLDVSESKASEMIMEARESWFAE